MAKPGAHTMLTARAPVSDGDAILQRHYDVVIIGSGAGGSSLACQLSRTGRQVLVVERGDYLKPRTRSATDRIGIYISAFHLQRDAPIACVGGQTKFYGSALYRLRESDFHQVRHESGFSPAWPITYADLEPYYHQAETLYRVHGSPDGDLSEPPRCFPYPYPPIDHGQIVSDMVQRLTRTGAQVSAIPRGLDHRPGGSCVLCPTCDAHYCSLDAKMDAEIAALRPALATGNVQLVTRTDCLRVLTDDSGRRAVGVRLRQNESELTVHADAVAICAGIPGTALLLRRSRTHVHPDGLGNQGGALGRYLGGHSTGMIFPFVRWTKVPPIHTKSFAINQYYASAPDWPYPTGTIQIAGQTPFWEEASRAIRPIARVVGTHSLMCFYMTEALPRGDTGLIFAGDTVTARVPPLENSHTFAKLRDLAVAAFHRAGYPVLARRRPPYLWHEVGTARFGTDPATSVADPTCQVHGIAGLYVVDASILPSAGAVNTGLTIIALALRLGDHIARQASGLRQTAGAHAPHPMLAHSLPTS
jgi:choline dehydrogenase-like flavoprotein